MEKRYQVFVSSTYNDLVDERKEVSRAILECDCFPAGMELFPASSKKQWEIIKRVIDDSDYYLLIVAGRYGTLGTNDIGYKLSYTEIEFDYALKTKKPIIAFLHRDPEKLRLKIEKNNSGNKRKFEKFREKAMNGRVTYFWENKDDLRAGVLKSLPKLIRDFPTKGWVKSKTKHYDPNSSIKKIVNQFQSQQSKNENIEEKLENVFQQLDLLTTGLFNRKKRILPKKKIKEVPELSDQEFEKLSLDEKEAYLNQSKNYIIETINSDPHGAFLDLALGAFEDALNNQNNNAITDFNYLAGLAIQHSDQSILMVIAMTLMKTIIILRKRDPKNSTLEFNNIKDVLSDHYYFRLHLITHLVIELIHQERNGKLVIKDNFKSKAKELLFDLIDVAIICDKEQ
jgi:hypothetical protein